MPKLILASSSRYRKEMLQRLRLPFDVIAPEVDETPRPDETADALSLRLAGEKAAAVARREPGSVVIGADQVLTLDGQSLGKPGSHTAAVQQLQRLSGRTVTFHSALVVTDGLRTLQDDVMTHCEFRSLSDAEIEFYLRAETPYDTAGSAKAETLGIALMARMTSDDPTAIIGLPLISLSNMLREFNIDPLRPTHSA